MRRVQLERAIRTAGQIIDADELDVVGSVSISIDGVDLPTSALPAGWRDRLVRVQNANTAAPSGEPEYIGWCLDREDVCVAKLYALREKDQNFVGALLDAGLVDPDVIARRLPQVTNRSSIPVERALRWLDARRSR